MGIWILINLRTWHHKSTVTSQIFAARLFKLKGNKGAEVRITKCGLLQPIAVTSTVILTKWYGKLQLQLIKKKLFFGCRGTELEVIV